MSLSPFDSPIIYNYAVRLSLAKTADDLFRIQRQYGGRLTGIRAIVSLPTADLNSPVPFIPLSNFSMQKNVVSFFAHSNLYFLQNTGMMTTQFSVLPSVAFDSNAAGYVNMIVKHDSLSHLPTHIRETFDVLLREQRNFENLFYFFENAGQAFRVYTETAIRQKQSPVSLWRKLNKSFRQNIVSITLFNTVDCDQYILTGKLKYEIRYIQAVRDAVRTTYEFYANPDFRSMFFEDLLPKQRFMVLHLLEIINIQLSSKSGVRKKMTRYFKFIQASGEVYDDRMAMMALRYFQSSTSTPILKKINKDTSKKHLLQIISNIAWDMSAIRYLEYVFSLKLEADFTVPFLLSFDNALCKLLRSFPIKVIVYEPGVSPLFSIPEINTKQVFDRYGLRDITNWFFSEENLRIRGTRTMNPQRLLVNIRKVHRELTGILSN